MTIVGKSLRRRERLELALPTRVHCRESLDHQWVELTRLLDVTPFGARFSLSRPTETGLWSLQESHEGRRVPSSEPRPETRHNIPVEVKLDVFDEKGAIALSETSVTENISRRGAAVFTTLNVTNGRFVRLTSAQYNLAITAVVRARRTGADGINRLHLEFIGQDWPLG